MTYPMRDQYHQARKAFVRYGDALWPSFPKSDLLETLLQRQSAPPQFTIDTPMPREALDWIEINSIQSETEAIYKTNGLCTVDPKMGILFRNGRVVWGSSDVAERERSPRYWSHVSKPKDHLDAAILLHHMHGDNYFHFFLYVMSKIWLIEDFGLPKSVPFLINENAARTRFFRQAMELGAFQGRQVIVQKKHAVISVAEAYLPRPHFCRKSSLAWMSKQFTKTAQSTNGQPIFALRAQNAANGRVFRNQNDVTQLMQDAGFLVIDPAELDLAGQADLFSKAPVIVGAHGAALTNILFRAGQQTGVVELFNPGMGSPHYFMLARELGFTYRSTITKNPEGRAFTASTEVDLDALQQIVDDMRDQLPLQHPF